MKKIALLATAAFASMAMADAPAASVTGFYAGANVGVANTNVKYNFQNAGAAAASTQNYSIDAGKMGLQYGLLGGYNMGLGNGAVVGVELFVGGDSTKVKTMNDNGGNTQNIGQSNVKRTMYYGFAPRVGYMITPSVLAYVRLGVEGGKWKAAYTPNAATITQSGQAAGTSAAAYQATFKTSTASKNRINFAPGVGLDVFASKNVFMRAQYHYVFGPKLTILKDISAVNNSGPYAGASQTQTFKTSQHVVTLAVGYKF